MYEKPCVKIKDEFLDKGPNTEMTISDLDKIKGFLDEFDKWARECNVMAEFVRIVQMIMYNGEITVKFATGTFAITYSVEKRFEIMELFRKMWKGTPENPSTVGISMASLYEMGEKHESVV